MHLRPMLRTDLPDVVDIALDAFYNDDFHRWLIPALHDPTMTNARRRLYFDLNRDRFISNSITGVVCVQVSNEKASKERVLGYAWWERKGSPDSPSQKAYTSEAKGLGFWFERSLTPLRAWYGRWIDRNPVYKPDRFIAFREDTSDWGSKLPAHWYCAVLAVRPDEEGKGVGTMLLRWGLDKADQEEIPSTLEASIAGTRIYRKHGFKTIDWGYIKSYVDHFLESHPMTDMKCNVVRLQKEVGNDFMIYDPKRIWTRDVIPGDQDWIEHGGFVGEIDIKWSF